MSQHIVPMRVYFVIFFALMILTATTVWVAFFDLGAVNDAVALGIASTKAMLVILYFMHVRYGSRLTWIFAAVGFFFLFHPACLYPERCAHPRLDTCFWWVEFGGWRGTVEFLSIIRRL